VVQVSDGDRDAQGGPFINTYLVPSELILELTISLQLILLA
jgi:hypothetical protein